MLERENAWNIQVLLGFCLGTSLRKGVGHEIEILDCCYFCSVAQSCPILCNPGTTTCETSLSFIISLSLLKLTSTESVMPSNHLVLCCSLLRPSSFPASGSFLMSWFFTSHGKSIHMAKVLEHQHQPFQ